MNPITENALGTLLKVAFTLVYILVAYNISLYIVHLTCTQLSLYIDLYFKKQHIFLLRNYDLCSIYTFQIDLYFSIYTFQLSSCFLRRCDTKKTCR